MLQGLLVLDLTRHLPGPYATQLLADLGARVVKVEAPPAGDPVRAFPPHDDRGVSAMFRALNQGKESLAIDLKRPEGAALLLELCAKADVLVEGFRPGVLERLGLGPAACQARNPALVWCSISGYGQDGPYRDRPGHDLTYQAYAGALGVNADREGRVVAPGLQAGDMLASFGALVGVLAALHERARTGRGRVIDAAMLDALVSVQALHLATHAAGARAVPGHMPLTGAFPCYRVYRAQDGRHVALGALEPKFWDAFCEAVMQPAWVGRGMDASLHAEVEALFATRPRDEWRLILEGQDVCMAPVLDYDEVLTDPQVEARGLVGNGRAGLPFKVDGLPSPTAPGQARPVAERVGEHGRAVLQDVLGLDASAIDELAARGAISLDSAPGELGSSSAGPSPPIAVP